MNKFNGKPFHDMAKVHNKKCVVCNSTFVPKSGIHKFCSSECKGKWQYITGQKSTENQYTAISGNWKRYLSRLLYAGGRKRDGLNVQQLLSLLEKQEYRCAISGLDLTCELSKGIRFTRNVSIDRIEAGAAIV